MSDQYTDDVATDDRLLYVSDATVATTARQLGIDYWMCGRRHQWPVEEGLCCPDPLCGLYVPTVPLVLLLRTNDRWRESSLRLAQLFADVAQRWSLIAKERDYLRKSIDLLNDRE